MQGQWKHGDILGSSEAGFGIPQRAHLTEGENADDHIPDSRDRFLALIEILEKHESEKKLDAAQVEATTGLSHQSSHTAAPVPAYQSGQAAAAAAAPGPAYQSGQAATRGSSDDYLKAKALQCQVSLQGNIIDWDQLLGLDLVKHRLERTMKYLSVRYRMGKEFCGESGLPPGLLIHGPQGCGKTSIEYSFAKKSNLPLLQLDNDITGKFVGETTKYDDTTFCSCALLTKSSTEPSHGFSTI